MEQINQILHLLNEIQNSLNSLNRDEFYSTTTRIQSILDRFYPKDSSYQGDLSYIRKESNFLVINKKDYSALGGPSLSELKEECNRFINSLKIEIEQLGIPSKNDVKIDKSINLNIKQSQNQTQIQNQSVELALLFQLIKDEITGKQYKEIEEIAKEELNPQKAKSKIIEKIKSFGENVCSNILANIITNPSIWTGIK